MLLKLFLLWFLSFVLSLIWVAVQYSYGRRRSLKAGLWVIGAWLLGVMWLAWTMVHLVLAATSGHAPETLDAQFHRYLILSVVWLCVLLPTLLVVSNVLRTGDDK